MNGEYALDVLSELRRSLDDYAAIRKAVRGRSRRGRTVDVAYATNLLADCIRDLLDSCTELSGCGPGVASELAALAVGDDAKARGKR